MKITTSLNLLFDYVPRFTGNRSGHDTPKIPVVTSRSPFKDELLAHPYESGDIYITLADSLNALRTGVDMASREQLASLKAHVQVDAKNLVAHILPPETAVSLGVSDEIIKTYEATPQPTPSLRDVFLLVEACDALQDHTLNEAVEYILETSPPTFSDELVMAYAAAAERDTPILEEYSSIVAAVDDKLDQASFLVVADPSQDTAASPAPTKRAPEEILGSTQPIQ